MKLKDLINTLDDGAKVVIFCPCGNGGNRLLYKGEIDALPWGYMKFAVKTVFIDGVDRLGVLLAEAVPLDYLN